MTNMTALEASLAALDAPRAPKASATRPITPAEYKAARAFVATRMVRTQADIDALLAARTLKIAAE